jgi:hypothetical protein
LGLIWLSPKNIIYYCPGCSKSVAIVGSVKNLLSCSGTHSKGLFVICIMNYLDYVPEPFRSFPIKFGSSQQSVIADFVATPED